VRNLQVHVGKVDGKLVEPIVIDEVSYQVDLGERFQVDKMVQGHRLICRRGASISPKSAIPARMLRDRNGKIEWVSSPVLKTVRATDAG
jgi:hypothetical protein